MQVTTLGPRDVGDMRRMLDLFGNVFGEVDAYTRRQPDDAYLAALLASDFFVAIGGFDDGVMVGGLAGYVLPKFEQAKAELYIYDLAVAESHRRQGLATLMIEHLKHVAASRGAHVIFVQADYGDQAAIELYSRLGRREDVMHFDIDVAGNGA